MSRELNQRLAEVIGINPKHCTGFDLRVRVNELPALTVHTLLISDDDIEGQAEAFDLTLRPRAFDLDRECERALRRVYRVIDLAAQRAQAQLRRSR